MLPSIISSCPSEKASEKIPPASVPIMRVTPITSSSDAIALARQPDIFQK